MGRELHSNPVSRTQPLKIPYTRAGRMRQHHIFVPELQPVGRARKQFDHDCLFTSGRILPGRRPPARFFLHGLVIP